MAAAANTVVDGLSADRVIDVQSEGVVRIENLSIYGGLISEGFGGGIRAQSTLELAGVNFEANHAIGMTGSDGSSVGGGGGGGGAAGLGGAIYSFDAYVTIEPGNEGCVFTDNIASGGNGGNGRGNGGSFTGNGGTRGGYFGGQGSYAAASAGGYQVAEAVAMLRWCWRPRWLRRRRWRWRYVYLWRRSWWYWLLRRRRRR